MQVLRQVYTLFGSALLAIPGAMALQNCGGSSLPEPIPLSRLAGMAAAGKTQELAVLARRELDYQNRRNATLLATLARGHLRIRGGALGNSAAFSHGATLHFWQDGSWEKFEAQGEILDFSLSVGSSRAALVSRRPDAPAKCVTTVLNLADEELEGHVYPSDCRGTPGVSDDGGHLIVMQDGRLQVFVRDATSALRNTAQLGPFKKKFKNVPTNLAVGVIQPGYGLVFHGAAGYYDLYRTTHAGTKPRKMGAGFTRPRIFFEAPGLDRTAPQSTGLRSQLLPAGGASSAPDQRALVMHGGAGRIRMRNLELAQPPRILSHGTFEKVAYSSDMAYVAPRKKDGMAFLLKQGELLVRQSGTKQQSFPVLVHRFVLFRGGLLYEDKQHNVWFRTRPFDARERALLAYLDKKH